MRHAKPGTIYLVGAGPGDPGLVTVRGLELLRSANVVLHDELVPEALLSEATGFLEYAGKRGTAPKVKDLTQDTIDQKMIEHARAGRSVVRLKGGDPYLFGRGSEEARVLARAGVAFEVVPGVTSPIAAAAYAGFSVTHRDLASSVVFVSATMRDGALFDFTELAGFRGTICVLMGHRRLTDVCASLIEKGGRSATSRAAVVRAGTRSDQQVIEAPLGEIAAREDVRTLKSPVLFFVGDVIGLRKELRFFDTRPLLGKRVLSLRSSQQASSVASALAARGATAICRPIIETRRRPLSDAHAALFHKGFAMFDAIVFTSENAVRMFFDELHAARKDLRILGRGMLVAIGRTTARALEAAGAVVDLVSDESNAEGLLTSLAKAFGARGGLAGSHVLIPRARVARELLPEELQHAGATVEVIPLYETVPVSVSERAERASVLDRAAVDVVLLTSSSIASAFADLIDEAPARARGLLLASIGPVTTNSAVARGLSVEVRSEVATLDGLIDALESHVRTQRVPVPAGL